mmetsp:Transcript_88260/g.156264  ORF Transcript_88260/g.156264 Transcript_88260/m.156264 type:complete len:342 (+) Transcript_88260:168-1193(+)
MGCGASASRYQFSSEPLQDEKPVAKAWPESQVQDFSSTAHTGPESNPPFDARTRAHLYSGTRSFQATGLPVSVTSHISAAYETQYQWQLKNGAWADYDDDEQQYLLAAWASGKDVVGYSARGMQYRVEFVMMRQINETTGQVRQVRVKPRHDSELNAAEATGEQGPATVTDPPLSSCPDMGEKPQVGFSGRPAGQRAGSSAAHERARPGARPEKRFSLHSEGARSQPTKQSTSYRQHSQHARQNPADDTRHTESPEGQGDMPGEMPLPTLPANVTWPANPVAKNAAVELFTELARKRGGSAQERRMLYRSLCLRWHPDKNLDKEDVATEVFQFLQALRSWY